MKSTVSRNIIKYKLIEQHMNLVRSGRYAVASRLLYLIRKRRMLAGLGNVDFEVEMIAEECGCRIRYGLNYYTAEIIF